jgi:acetyltransferase-like isoleucine patch superfamily enzyme
MLDGLRLKLRWTPFALGYKYGPLLMSRLRRAWVLLRHPHANIRIAPTAYLGPGFSLHITGSGTFEAGPYAQFRRNFRAEIEGNGRVSFGTNAICTYDVLIQCTTLIEVEDRVMLGQACFVADGNHRFRDLTKGFLDQGYDHRPVHIGREAAVTSKCTVLADIGERAMIGANSVVTRPIPAFSVAVGAPAKVIDYFGPAPAADAEGAPSTS